MIQYYFMDVIENVQCMVISYQLTKGIDEDIHTQAFHPQNCGLPFNDKKNLLYELWFFKEILIVYISPQGAKWMPDAFYGC